MCCLVKYDLKTTIIIIVNMAYKRSHVIIEEIRIFILVSKLMTFLCEVIFLSVRHLSLIVLNHKDLCAGMFPI